MTWSRLSLGACALALVFLAGCKKDGGTSDLKYPVLASQALRLDAMGVAVTPAASRPFIYTNKVDAYLYGEAAGPHSTSWEGFNVRGFRFVDDWHWNALGSTSFAGATVYPDHAVRAYEGGLSERITLLDGRAAVVIEPSGLDGALVFRPLMADSTTASSYVIQAAGGALAVSRANHQAPANANDYPVWIVFKAAGAIAVSAPEVVTAGGMKPRVMAPGRLELPAATPVVMAVGNTVDEATALADDVLAHRAEHLAARTARLQALLESHLRPDRRRRVRPGAGLDPALDGRAGDGPAGQGDLRRHPLVQQLLGARHLHHAGRLAPGHR
ncbi:MAG: hypothetical protein QM767_23580 [Anaeromyxobacter sp.]